MKKSKLIGVLYFVSVVLTLVLGIVFSESIVFHASTILVIAFLILQVICMIPKDVVNNTNLASGNLNKEEVYSLCKTIAYVTLCAIPFLFPFIIFFNLKVKTIVSVSLWFATFVFGFVIFRIKYSDKIKKRLSEEANILTEQQKREEQGLI